MPRKIGNVNFLPRVFYYLWGRRVAERTPDTITLTKQLASVAKIVIEFLQETSYVAILGGGRGDLRGVLVEVCRGGL